jgi:protein-tyrosine kinase
MKTVVQNVTPLPSGDGLDASLLGELLMEQGKLCPEDVERALHVQRLQKVRFGEALCQLGLVSAEDIEDALQQQFGHSGMDASCEACHPDLYAASVEPHLQMEVLRALRTRLLLQWFTESRRELAITALGRGDGASLLAANLAISFAQLGKRVALVDANLRRPRLAELFQVRESAGLSDVLIGRATIDDLSSVRSISRLSLLPAGNLVPNPQELLCRDSFQTLRDSLTTRFDIVLYDTPALADADDACCVASSCEGIFLVARKGRSELAAAENCARLMQSCGIVIAGAALNAF